MIFRFCEIFFRFIIPEDEKLSADFHGQFPILNDVTLAQGIRNQETHTECVKRPGRLREQGRWTGMPGRVTGFHCSAPAHVDTYIIRAWQ